MEIDDPEYAGTFYEFNDKVLQFGFIAMFSAAFPLGALASAVANSIELKIDAGKLFDCRRVRVRERAQVRVSLRIIDYGLVQSKSEGEGESEC